MPAARLWLVLLLVLSATGCTRPLRLAELPKCQYANRPSSEERIFVMPTIEEYVAGGTAIYAEPNRASRLRVSSWAYERELAGRKYKRLDEVEGVDGRYVRWLLEDCRLFFTPSGAER